MIISMKNRYIIRSHISERKFREILRFFCMDIEASKIAILSGVSRQCVNRICLALRKHMAIKCEQESQIQGEIEIDESYFGTRRVRGKRGRGAAHKTPVFGILKRDGLVRTQIVKNCSAKELLPILQNAVKLENSTIYSDSWKAYDGLVDVGAMAHYRVKHSNGEFANGKNHINGIENFWGYAKHRMSKFRGIRKENFYIHKRNGI